MQLKPVDRYPNVLRPMREHLGMTIEEMAVLIQVNWRTIYRYEQGIAFPKSQYTMRRLLEAYGFKHPAEAWPTIFDDDI